MQVDFDTKEEVDSLGKSTCFAINAMPSEF